MIQYEIIDIIEGIDFNKTISSKKCMIFVIIVRNLSDFFIVTVKNVDYRCYIVGIDKKDAISLLNNSVLYNKGVL